MVSYEPLQCHDRHSLEVCHVYSKMTRINRVTYVYVASDEIGVSSNKINKAMATI